MSKIINFFKKHFVIITLILLSGLFLWWRLVNLTIVPVFADEAIYIRWSQLMIDDWQQYAFFPLNDGKTPLQMWLMIPLLKTVSDPLVAGRLLSIIFGLGQMWLTYAVMRMWTKNKKVSLLACWLTILLPGFILINRLALIDTQLTFFLTATFYLTCRGLGARYRESWPWLVGGGLCFGLALLTKTSALLFLPVFASLLLPYAPRWKRNFIQLALVVVIGGSCLLLLKLHPAFSQLVSRGGDFLWPWAEFSTQPWTIITNNFHFFGQILNSYLTPLLLFFSMLLSILVWPRDRRPGWILLAAAAFLVPMMIVGKVIYPRYLLPALPFFVWALCLSFTQLLGKKMLLFKIILIVLISLSGAYFTVASIEAPEQMNLVAADQKQYFSEWSAGYGILETVALIDQDRAQAPTLVLTEGYFGTLPDALIMYYFNRNVDDVRIEGVGQPVDENRIATRQDLIDQYSQVLLVVNSHRLVRPIENSELIAEFARPIADAPTLQVWRLK